MQKRTRDLSEEEILQFKKTELRHWMDRAMRRLYTLVNKQRYDELASRFVTLCARGIESVKRALIEVVNIIKQEWRDTPV
jgi:hypothetical protein